MTEKEKAGKLRELYESILGDPGYRTDTMGSIFVPGTGSLRDNLLVFVGEAPGREEEKERLPFVGSAGRNLNALLDEIELPREEVFITNLVKYRPFTIEGANRRPTPDESRTGLAYLLQELELLAPRLVVCLGLAPAQALLGDLTLKMSNANGVLFEKHHFRVLVAYHPSPFNYRIPAKRRELQAAFRRLREVYDALQ